MNTTQSAVSAERPHYDPFSFYDDPYPIYTRLRREARPLRFSGTAGPYADA